MKKKSMKPGGGGRFAKLVGKLKAKGKSTKMAKGIAAKVGREKFGKKKMASFAKKGKARMSHKKRVSKGNMGQ